MGRWEEYKMVCLFFGKLVEPWMGSGCISEPSESYLLLCLKSVTCSWTCFLYCPFRPRDSSCFPLLLVSECYHYNLLDFFLPNILYLYKLYLVHILVHIFGGYEELHSYSLPCHFLLGGLIHILGKNIIILLNLPL